jgi:hypothetical protein
LTNYFGLIFLAVFLLSNSTAAASANPCWIDRIKMASNGMRVYFSTKSKAGVFIKRANGRNNEYVIIDGKLKDLYGVESAKANPGLDFLLMSEGDFLHLMQGVHDGCSLEAVQGTSGPGVQGSSFFSPQGLPPAKAKVFIPAAQ